MYRVVSPRHVRGTSVRGCAQNCNWMILDQGLPCNSFTFDSTINSCALARWSWLGFRNSFFQSSAYQRELAARQRYEGDVQDRARWMSLSYYHNHSYIIWLCGVWQPCRGKYRLQKSSEYQENQRWFCHRFQLLCPRVRQLWTLQLLDLHEWWQLPPQKIW